MEMKWLKSMRMSSDGKNDKNIKKRVSKGIGQISDVMEMLEKITIGEFYFKTCVAKKYKNLVWTRV